MVDFFFFIDVGGMVVKVVVFDVVGWFVVMCVIEVEMIYCENGWVECELEVFWCGMVKVICEFMVYEIVLDCIVVVVCMGFGNGVFFVDGEGRGMCLGIVFVDYCV